MSAGDSCLIWSVRICVRLWQVVMERQVCFCVSHCVRKVRLLLPGVERSAGSTRTVRVRPRSTNFDNAH